MALPTSLPAVNMVTPWPIDLDLFWKEIREIGKEVQMVMSEVLEKFFPLRKHYNFLGDLLVGFKRFKNVVRWIKFFFNQEIQQKEKEENKWKRKWFSIRCTIDTGRKGFLDISQNKLKSNDFQTSADRIK